MWNPGNGNNQTGQVAARMETTPSLGSASISVSQQQTPKKFAPVVAPKPKFNPYKQMGDPAHSDPAGKDTGKRMGHVAPVHASVVSGPLDQTLLLHAAAKFPSFSSYSSSKMNVFIYLTKRVLHILHRIRQCYRIKAPLHTLLHTMSSNY